MTLVPQAHTGVCTKAVEEHVSNTIAVSKHVYHTCTHSSRAAAGRSTWEDTAGEEWRAGAETEETAGVCRGNAG